MDPVIIEIGYKTTGADKVLSTNKQISESEKQVQEDAKKANDEIKQRQQALTNAGGVISGYVTKLKEAQKAAVGAFGTKQLKDFEMQAIQSFKAMIQGAEKGSIQMDDFNQSIRAMVEGGLAEAGVSMLEFGTALQAAGTDIDEFLRSIQQGVMEEFGENFEKAEPKVKSMRTQLKELKQELALMEDAGEDGTQEFLNMAKAAAKLEDQVGDTAERIRVMSSDTANMDAAVESVSLLASGFQLAEGAAQLFGEENEDMQKALVKLNAIMAVTQSIQQAQDFMRGQSILKLKLETAGTWLLTAAQKAYGWAVAGTSSLLKVLKVAMISTGIGALVVGIGMLIANFTKVKDAVLNFIPGLQKAAEWIGNMFNKMTDFLGITSETERQMDRLNDANEKRLKDAERWYESNSDKYDKFTQAKIEADINYQKKRNEINKDETLSEAEKQKTLVDLSAQRDRAILRADQDRLKEQTDAERAASEKQADERKKRDDKQKQKDEEKTKEKQAYLDKQLQAENEMQKLLLQNQIDTNKDIAEDEGQLAFKRVKAAEIVLASQIELANKEAEIAKQGIKTPKEIELAELKRIQAVEAAEREHVKTMTDIRKGALDGTKAVIDASNLQMQASMQKAITDANARADELKASLLKKQEALNGWLNDMAQTVNSQFDNAGAKVLVQAVNLRRSLQAIQAQADAGEITQEQAKWARKKEIILAATASIQAIANEVFQAQTEQRQSELARDLEALNTRRQAELDNKNMTEQQKDDVNKRYAAKERQLRLKSFEEEKKAKRTQAIINGLLGVTNALASGPPPYNFIMAALVAAIAAIQVAKISSAQPGFRKGGYTGNKPEDRVAGVTHGREYVSHAEATKRYRPALEAMHKLKFEEYLETIAPKYSLPKLAKAPTWTSTKTESIDYDKLGEAVAKHASGEPRVVMNADENGIVMFLEERGARTRIMNKRYST